MLSSRTRNTLGRLCSSGLGTLKLDYFRPLCLGSVVAGSILFLFQLCISTSVPPLCKAGCYIPVLVFASYRKEQVVFERPDSRALDYHPQVLVLHCTVPFALFWTFSGQSFLKCSTDPHILHPPPTVKVDNHRNKDWNILQLNGPH